MMKIQVFGPRGETVVIKVNPNSTINEVMEQVEDETGLTNQRFTIHGERDVIQEPMKIYIRDTKGRKFLIDNVEPLDTIGTIKIRIEKQENIPIDDQYLLFGDIPLNSNKKTLFDYNIRHKSILDLEPMTINIQTTKGEVFELIVDPSDSISSIKDVILDVKGIPLDEQILSHKGNPLSDNDDTSSLKDCSIRHRDTLNLEKINIYVKDGTNKGQGQVYTFKAEPTDTVQLIQKLISKKINIPIKEQLLSFQGDMLIDNPGKTLRECNIKHKSTLDLEQMKIKIKTFLPDDKYFKLDVEPSDTLQSIKERIQDKKDIPIKDQILFYKDNRLDDMNMSLADCSIKHLDKLKVEEHMKVLIQDDTKDGDGKVYTLYTEETYLIGTVMDMIADEVGISKKKQLLSYDESLIFDKDVNTSLVDYGIKHMSTIHLVQMMITVKTYQGDTFLMAVDPSDKCNIIKQKVKEMKGIPLNDQIAVFNGQRMDDTDSLKDCGIKHGDVVYINEPMKVFVQDDTKGANGKIYTFYMEETDTIHDVSMLIQKKIGIEKDKQRLTFEGEKLEEEDKTLTDCGIKHEDTIHVRKSYIPINWKQTVDEKYGKVKTTTYRTSYSGENDDHFLQGKIRESDMEIKIIQKETLTAVGEDGEVLAEKKTFRTKF